MMDKFFSQDAQSRLAQIKRSHTIYCFDFDGTLCPIVDKISEVKIEKKVEECLEALALRSPMAVISGRSVLDLQKYIHFKPRYLIGNHGMEENQLPLQLSEEKILNFSKCKIIIEETLKHDCQKLGIVIEDKKYSLSIHFRQSHNPFFAEERIIDSLKNLDVEIIRGKMVINVLPKNSRTKGGAILDLLKREQAEFAFFIGDDDTDETIFKLNLPEIFTVRVGQSHSSKAAYYIDSQHEILNLLQNLLS